MKPERLRRKGFLTGISDLTQPPNLHGKRKTQPSSSKIIINGDDGCLLEADSQPKSVGLVWGLAATWHSVCIHRMNRVNSHNVLATSSSSSLFGMHHQCVAPRAANSLHSGLFRASSIASCKVRLCRARSFFRVAIPAIGVGLPNWPSPLTLGNCSQNSPGVCWLVHSDQMTKQRESFLYNRSKGRLFG